MKDCVSTLYELARRREPCFAASDTEQWEVQRREEALRQLKAAAPELRHQIFELSDADNILESFRCRHAFRLGLDLGLSLSRELQELQQEDAPTPP